MALGQCGLAHTSLLAAPTMKCVRLKQCQEHTVRHAPTWGKVGALGKWSMQQNENWILKENLT